MGTHTGSQEPAERYGRHLQRAGLTAGVGTGLTARPLGERGQRVKQEGRREGQDPLPFTGGIWQGKRENAPGRWKAAGHDAEGLVLKSDGPAFESCLYLH